MSRAGEYGREAEELIRRLDERYRTIELEVENV